jgi:hypothetical protein
MSKHGSLSRFFQSSQNRSTPRAGRLARRALVLAAGVVATLLSPALALGQSRTVSPNTDGVLMRSGNGSSWYEIATLKAGQVLKTDGEVDGWLRVEYPAGLNAVVKNDEVEVKGDVATLTRRSRLRALSMTNPVLDESFRFVCERELAPGTTLKVVGRIKDRQGVEAGYIVQAPECARGFVLARDMKDAKVEAPAPAPAPVPTAAPAQPKPVEAKPTETKPAGTTPAPSQPTTPPTQPAPQPVAPAPSTPAEPGTNPASTSSVAQPPAQPAMQPAANDPNAPAVPGGTPGGTPGATPTETMPGSVTDPVVPPLPVEPAKPAGPTLRQLDRKMQDFLATPAAEAGDPQELIEAYTKYAVEAESKPGGSRLVQLADQRLEVLRLRQKVYNMLPEIQGLEDMSRNALANYQGTIDRLIANRQYLVAGRLVPSTVYDGGRLPLMYRLVSIDPAINRTIAYIVPSAELQLEQKTGAIVGVLGDGTIEPSSLVQIIKPTVVDVLRAAESTP